jgi:hypothetical protein
MLLTSSGSKRVGLVLTLSIFFLSFPKTSKAQAGLALPPVKTPFSPLDNPQKTDAIQQGFSLGAVPPPAVFNHKTALDSTGKNIIITHRAFNLDLSVPNRLTIDSYLSQKYKTDGARQWKQSVIKNMELGTDRSGGGKGITIQTPKIKSKTFKRITGGETLSLNVTGDITIDGSMRNEKRSQKNLALDRAPNTNFQMKQTQRFQVEGKIGNNISIRVDQDSERDFDFENAVKLDYTGNEDGIVQKIEAGNVALSLPATRFVMYSAQSSGLFGIKSQFKVGALDITAIASMEKAQKKKLSLTGGKEESSQKVQDYDYKRFTYFFINEYFRNQFKILDPVTRLHTFDPDSSVLEMEVYKSDALYESREGAFRAIAFADMNNTDTTAFAQEQQMYKGFFIRLEPNTDYVFNKELGYITMNYPLQEESEVLAVSFKNSLRQYGVLKGASKDTVKNPFFKMIKPRKPRPSDKTWYLEWKNVYSIGSRNLNAGDFDLGSFRIYYKTPSGDPYQSWEYQGQKRGFLEIFGLDKINTTGDTKPDDIIDNNPNIISWSRGEIVFPDLLPFNPDDPNFPSPFRSRAIYDTTLQDVIRKESKFYLEFKSSSKSANYSLGAYVVDGSEEVLWNGTPLVRGKDYILDPFSGNLTILRQEALTPSSNLEVRYESQQLFSVDKKSLIGVRAEYALNQNSANKSFIGATLLYFNQKTMDQRIRIGSEGGPYQNLVWDFNTALNFQPKFVTRALDALPVVEASAPSLISFEGEIAQVIPNPNTLNNKSTGDKDGVAYMDDFEGSKRQIPLSIIRNSWIASSPPTASSNAAAYLSKKAQFSWFNPYIQTHINEIWPNREVTTNYGGTNATDVLTLALTPNNALPYDSLKTSWGGITMDLSSGYSDQTESRFLEIWIRGDKGTLHFDLGQVSEDMIPNGILNTEDKYRSGIRNMMLDDDEDTGLDGMYGSDPPSLFFKHQDASVDWNSLNPTGTPYDFFDLNRNGKKEAAEPWSYDDYKYDQYNNSQINGTENNQNDGITRYPNTEDINGNSSLDTNNDYNEFTFSLDKTSQDTVYIGGKGGQNSHDKKFWYLYRIPLNKPSKVVGQPDWSRVEYIRLWMDGLTSVDSCSIAEISLTGNEWKYQGTAMGNSSSYTISNDSTMTISVVNTHENPRYTPPPGVSGVIDPIQKIESREQSLELTLYDLRPDESAVVEKQFFKEESIVNYRNLKMYVHGGNYENTMTSQDSIELFLRWGSDTQNRDYYEVRLPVYPGWDERNNIFASFEDLSRLKVEKEVHGLESISETMENGHVLSVVGKPSLTNVRWLILGISNNNKNNIFSGGVWVDELRVSNVQKEKGMAMRARTDIKLSDVLSLNGEFTKQDADFHTVNDRFGGGMNSFSGSANSSIQFNKFLPSSWAVSIPIVVNYSKNVSTPKYLPNSDILVNKRTMPDSLIKKNQSISSQQGVNVSFSRTTRSRNFFLRYLIDPIRSSVNYSKSEMSDSRIRFSQNKSASGSLGYSLNLGGQSYIQPLKWLGDNGIVKKLSQTKFYYLPTTLNVDFSGNQSNREQHTREGISSIDTAANYRRSFNVALKPFTILSMDFSRSFSSDMRQESWYSVFSSPSPGDTTSMEQSFSTNLDPKIFSFFNPSLRFSSNYRWNNNVQMKSQGTNRSASIVTSLSLNGSFDPARMIQSFSKKSQPSSRRLVKAPDREEKKENPKIDKKKSVFSLLSIVRQTGSLFSKIEPLSVSVTQRDDRSDNGIVNGEPTFLYQLGFPNDSNLGFFYSPYVASNRVAKRSDLSFSFRTGLKVSSQLRLNFDYNFSNSENLSNVKTGSVSRSVYSIKESLVPFPSWSLSWSGLEKFPFISKYVRVISLSHNFSGKQNISWNNDRDKITQDQITKDFRPFAQISFTFKNGIAGNVQYTKTESFSRRVSYGAGKTKNANSSLSLAVNYSKTGGLRLPFFKKHSMQNTIDFSLSFESSSNVQFQSSQNDVQFNEDNIVSDTKNWSFKPKLSYRFSNTVTGGTYFELGRRSDKRIGNTNVTAFGINAAISLSGQ